MTWMLTATGVAFDLRFIKADAIDIADIAHHLAQINRYTGACRRPYSVAEHSLLVCEIVDYTLIRADPAVLLAALMHDAHEAYTQDLSAPFKEIVGPAWRVEEDRVQRAVLGRFGLLDASSSAAKLIHWADQTALVTERKQLLPPTGPTWAAEAEHVPIAWRDLSHSDAFTWLDWRQAFLDKFAELTFALENAQLSLVKG